MSPHIYVLSGMSDVFLGWRVLCTISWQLSFRTRNQSEVTLSQALRWSQGNLLIE